MSVPNIATPRTSRQENNFLLQDEFFIQNGQNIVQVKLTNDALVWTISAKRGFALRRLFSDSATVVEGDDQHLIPYDNNENSHLRTSHSYPNGFFSDKRTCHRLSISDIVGCEIARGGSVQDQACYLRIYAYPLLKKFLWKDSVRKRREIVFGFNKSSDFQKNHDDIEKWQSEIKKCIKKQSADSLELQSESTDDRKKLLIFINPFSGSGKALQMFQTRIVPILAESKVPYETVVTKYNGHARDVTKELDLNPWGGIVVVSGDGLIYEVINGLMARPDRLDAIKIPIGALPGGSGNALVSSMLYQAGETVKHSITTNAALLLIKNRIQPMDLVALDTSKGERLYSFLSVSWGIVADVDLESERYRNLGKARFTVGALARIMTLRKYSGKVHFLPINPAYRSKWSSYDKSSCEISTSGNRQQIESDNARQIKTSSSFVCSVDEPPAGVEQEVPTPLLSPLDQPVPNNWVTMSATDFVSVTAIYQSHLSQDMLVFPHSRLKDGCIYLAITRGDVSRYKVLQIFTAMQTGEMEILEHDCCEVIKVAAFRLEPNEEPKGVLMVDGEEVDYGPIQGQIVEGLARVFA